MPLRVKISFEDSFLGFFCLEGVHFEGALPLRVKGDSGQRAVDGFCFFLVCITRTRHHPKKPGATLPKTAGQKHGPRGKNKTRPTGGGDAIWMILIRVLVFESRDQPLKVIIGAILHQGPRCAPWTHGTLYTVLGRAKGFSDIAVAIPRPVEELVNVVWREFLDTDGSPEEE